ncbi:hypothetical protein HPHPH30_1549 [Helicobacter pylori Hp H-30]|nr:hypothetical protein HPHPH30_1549 [Helicobacter pylori Hp H-30]
MFLLVFALLGSFGLQVYTLFLFAKRLFLAVIFSDLTAPNTPKFKYS